PLRRHTRGLGGQLLRGPRPPLSRDRRVVGAAVGGGAPGVILLSRGCAGWGGASAVGLGAGWLERRRRAVGLLVPRNQPARDRETARIRLTGEGDDSGVPFRRFLPGHPLRQRHPRPHRDRVARDLARCTSGRRFWLLPRLLEGGRPG